MVFHKSYKVPKTLDLWEVPKSFPLIILKDGYENHLKFGKHGSSPKKLDVPIIQSLKLLLEL